MEENTQEELMVRGKEKSIFSKIKFFFRNLFCKAKIKNDVTSEIDNSSDVQEKDNQKEQFLEEIRNIEDDETRLIKLQKQYRSGEVKEEELTEEQINALCILYDKQIEALRKENEIKMQKLLEMRKSKKNI